MKVTYSININDMVSVTLTKEGLSIYETSGSYWFNMPDKNGLIKIQLWLLMNIFSSHIYMGAPTYFVDNEIIL